MKKRIFKKWNWEYDYGEEQLPLVPAPGCTHAVAYYDGEGRLFRVIIADVGAQGQSGSAKLTYDYFCDDLGRVVEKRSLDEAGQVVLLVRFFYDVSAKGPKQVAFNPQSGETRSIIRKDYLAKQNSGE